MRRFVLVLFILVSVGAVAASVIAGSRACAEMAVLDGYGARLKALGGEVSALPGEAHLWLRNPAGILTTAGWRAVGDLTWLDESVQGGLASVSTPDLRGRLRLAIAMGGAQARGQIGRTSSPVVYSQSQYFGRIGLAMDMGRGISGGLATNVTRRRYYDKNVHGSTVDLGVFYRIDSLWSLGAAWRGLTIKEMQYTGADVGSPRVWNAGAGLNAYPLDEWSTVSAVLGLTRIEDDDVALHIGLEFSRVIAERTSLSLRAGHNGEGVAAGGGLRWRWVGVDYAWARLPENDCLDEHGHTLSFSLDPLAAIREVIPSHDAAIANHRTEMFRYYLDLGLREMGDYNYLAARERFLQADAFASTGAQRQEIADALDRVGHELVYQQTYEDSLLWRQARDSIKAVEDRWRGMMMEQQTDCEQRLARQEQQVISSTIERYRADIPSLIEEDRYYDALGRITYILDHRPSDTAALAWRDEVRRQISVTLAGDMGVESPEDLLEELDVIFRSRLGVDESVSDSIVDVWYQQGINYSREGEYRKAIEQWRKVLQARPDHPTVRQDIEVARRRLNARTGEQPDDSN